MRLVYAYPRRWVSPAFAGCNNVNNSLPSLRQSLLHIHRPTHTHTRNKEIHESKFLRYLRKSLHMYVCVSASVTVTNAAKVNYAQKLKATWYVNSRKMPRI